MNVFLVEDSEAIRLLLAARVRHQPGLNLAGEADTEERAYAMIMATRPDVVITDLSLAVEGSGSRLITALRASGYTGFIAVLSGQDAAIYRAPCLKLGADAFYDKAFGVETLFEDLAATLAAA
ncbi:response regulator [Paucibacter sp. R3-3]|uniref:Response regulator n=1 Tax=Roseateles agri TaxID=3098619 RepID=A0ABU5DKB2_9BURK|nr:response regulator [Paucibacter sp. R3-3]MDY0746734.1 response regulator [Paucibacter sp. R3-3]